MVKVSKGTEKSEKKVFNSEVLAEQIFNSMGDEVNKKDIKNTIDIYMKGVSLRGSKKRKDPNAPKGVKNAYILFSMEERPHIAKKNPNLISKEIMTAIAAKWKKMTPKQKKPYEDMAKEDKIRYEEEMANYAVTEAKEGEYGRMKVADLREVLKKRGLDIKGKKEDLVERLQQSDTKKHTDFTKMTLAQLKDLCKERGLATKGKKDDLVALLEENPVDTEGEGEEIEDEEEADEEKDEEADYEKMALPELKALCKEKGLDMKGLKKKTDFIALLQEQEEGDEEKDEEEGGNEDVDYEKMTLPELKALCKEKELDTKGLKKKSDFVSLLQENE